MTTTATRPAPARRPGPARQTGGDMLRVHARLAVWFWAIVAGVGVLLTLSFQRTEGVRRSTWELLEQAPRWFVFSMGILLVTGYLAAHVANGMTRRAFTAALAWVSAVVATGYAVVTATGYLVERAVFAARDWPTGLQGRHLYADSGQVGLVVLEHGVVLLVYAASGALVGASYYRLGGWWGTLALPLTVTPALLAEALVGSGWVGSVLASLGSPAAPATALVVAGCLLIAAVLVAATHALLRGAPLRTRTA